MVPWEYQKSLGIFGKKLEACNAKFVSAHAEIFLPLYRENQKIKKEVKRMGFYVPHKDADWEMNDNSEFYNYQGELNIYAFIAEVIIFL